MQKKSTATRSNRILRVLLKSVLFLFLFIIVIFLLLLTPPVQRFLSSRAENYLEKKLGTKVEIGRVGFGLSGKVVLRDIYLEDKTADTLLSGGTIRGRVNFIKLFSNDVRIKDLQISDVTLRIKRILPDTVFNFQFIVDAFLADRKKNPDTAQTAPLKLNISDLLNQRAYFYHDLDGNETYKNGSGDRVAISRNYGSNYSISFNYTIK